MINKNTDYSNRIDLSNKNNSLTKIIERIKPNSRVLEFGPAKGYMTRHLKMHLHCRVVCVEINPEFLDYLNPFAEKVILSDIDKLDWEKEFGELEKFDFIIFSDVLEHLYNPWLALKKSKLVLKEDGSLLASIPNVGYSGLVGSLLLGKFEYRPLGLLDKTHIRFFTRQSILELFEKNGFYIHKLDTVVLDWKDSEFKEDLVNVSGELLELIAKAKDSSVYQFVMEAKLMNPNNSILITQLENEIKELKASKGLALGKILLWTLGVILPKSIFRKISLRLGRK